MQAEKKGHRRPRWRIPRPRSLRGQLIGSVWLGMAAVYVPFALYTISRDQEAASQRQMNAVADQGQIVQLIAERWLQNMANAAQIAAETMSIRSLDAKKAQDRFDELTAVNPTRRWTLLKPSGELVTGENFTDVQLRKKSRMLADVRKGKIVVDIIPNCQEEKPCMGVAAPVHTKAGNEQSKPVGVLVMQVDLRESPLGQEIESQLNRFMVGNGIEEKGGPPKTLSPQNGKFEGSETLLVDDDGHIFFPLTTVNDAVSGVSREDKSYRPWKAIVKKGQLAKPGGSISTLEMGGKSYYVYAEPLDSGWSGHSWSVVSVTEKNSSYEVTSGQASELLLRPLLFLFIVSIVIAIVCRNVSRPILLAADTLKRLGAGDFEARIESDRDDELGTLFKDINETGTKLTGLLNERLSHAITDKQLETATEIQKEFIVRNSLCTEDVEIAAEFDPAYQIGADWYDVIHVNGVVYIVIADVCDKGIPSALFMSVFRSLIRYSLGERCDKESSQDQAEVLSSTIKRVNNYMATNHGLASMFATVFMAAYEPKQRALTYISAGHEKPLIIRQGNSSEPVELSTTGPAVGIFANASYVAKVEEFAPGDILFSYTDGLVDARSLENEAFSLKRVKKGLAGMKGGQLKPQEILNDVLKQVNHHIGTAEQFDDLTILVLKARSEQDQNA